MKKTIFLLLFPFLFSCNSEVASNATDSVDSTELGESVADGSNAIGSALDEQSGDAIASFKPHNLDWLKALPKAYAANCERVANLTCDNSSGSGVRSRTFSCTFGRNNQREMSGDMTLTYSDTNCSLQNSGDTVTRTFNRQLVVPRGSMTVTTSETEDYKGNKYGGGNVLTKTESGHTLKINGRHRNMTNSSGTKTLNVSTRSLQDIVVTGGIRRANRVIESGQVEVNHNLAKFTALYEPSSLQFDSQCCHPVGGQFTVTYSGTITGSATVVFESCGQAKMTKDGETKDISFDDEQCD